MTQRLTGTEFFYRVIIILLSVVGNFLFKKRWGEKPFMGYFNTREQIFLEVEKCCSGSLPGFF